MIKTLLIDDENNAIKTLQSYIHKYTEDLSVVGIATSKKEAIALIANTKYFDLILLDVNLGDGTAFEVLEQIPSRNFHVIFTTAYDQYAIKAFKYSALDYLLKPIDPKEFMDAIARLNTKDVSSMKDQLELASSSEKPHGINKIVINSSNEMHFIAIDDIIRLESEKNYTDIYLTNGKRITSSKTLKYYEDLLPDHIFFRTHQKHLINISFIKKFLKEDGGYVLLTDHSKLAVSRRKKEGLLNKLSS
tara:strand:- start:689 stop:1429 length:741 start_codon:yes stop_codon:yes gene_type:complete